MRDLEERPVYSNINPQEQPGAESRYIFFSPQGDLMALRIACDDVVNGDAFVKVLDKAGLVIAKVSNLIPWQLVRRDVLLEEPYREFMPRLMAEEKHRAEIDKAAELGVYGEAEYKKRHAPRMMMMGSDGSVMPVGQLQEEAPTEAQPEPERVGHYL